MSMSSAKLDTSSELLIQPYKRGICLIRPTLPQHERQSLYSLKEMLGLSMNIYLLNADSSVLRLNDDSASECGYFSAQDATGRSILEVAKNDTGLALVEHDRQVLRSQEMKIYEEAYTRQDDKEFLSLSFKFPLYAREHVAGIFGISIMMNMNKALNLAQSLSVLTNMGILSSAFCRTGALLSVKSSASVCFTAQEDEILRMLASGATAKIIGKKIGLSHRTIEHHLARLKLKTNSMNKSDLRDWAVSCRGEMIR